MESNTEDLLISYSEGKATKEEIAQVEQWIQEDESHKKVAEQIATLQFATDTIAMSRGIDTESSLSKINGLITKKERKIKGWVWPQRIAAMLAIPLLISTIWFYRQSEGDKLSAQMIEIKTAPGMTDKAGADEVPAQHLASDDSADDGESHADCHHHEEHGVERIRPMMKHFSSSSPRFFSSSTTLFRSSSSKGVECRVFSIAPLLPTMRLETRACREAR